MGPERRSNGQKIPWLSFVCLQLCNVIQRTHACSRLSFHSFSVLPQTTTSSLNHAQKLFSSQFRSFVFNVQSCKRESAFPPLSFVLPFSPSYSTPQGKRRRGRGVGGYGKGEEWMPSDRPSTLGEELIYFVPLAVACINWSC